MKALVINEPGELQVKDLSAPAIGADEVLVRMRAVRHLPLRLRAL
jgi:NADPH:quinone reductase-like Zn-dependent oxidoreductase